MNHILRIRNLTYLLTSLITLQAGIFFLSNDSFSQDSNAESQLTTVRSTPLSHDRHGTTSHMMVLFELEDEDDQTRDEYLVSRISAGRVCFKDISAPLCGLASSEFLFSFPSSIYLIDRQLRL